MQRDLEAFEQLSDAGDYRSAIACLHRNWDGNRLERTTRSLLAAQLACLYAQLHCLDEARSWLRVARGLRPEESEPAVRRGCETAQITLRLREGRYDEAFRLAERCAARACASGADDLAHLQQMLILGATGHLYLDRFDRCAGTLGHAESIVLPTPRIRARLLMIRGEALLWGHMKLSLEDWSLTSRRYPPATPEAGRLLGQAQHCFLEAQLAGGLPGAWSDAGSARLAAIAMLQSKNHLSSGLLEQQHERFARAGLLLERDRERVLIGFIHLLRGRAELARGWICALGGNSLEGGEPPMASLLRAASANLAGDAHQAAELREKYRNAMRAALGGPAINPQIVQVAVANWEPSLSEADSFDSGELRRRRLVGQAVRFIKINLQLPLHVDSVCEALGVSRRTLETAFQGALGESPKRVFDELRVREAARLVRSFTGPATRHAGYAELIAQHTGFSSYRAFYRVFVHAYGVSPVAALANPAVLNDPVPQVSRLPYQAEGATAQIESLHGKLPEPELLAP